MKQIYHYEKFFNEKLCAYVLQELDKLFVSGQYRIEYDLMTADISGTYLGLFLCYFYDANKELLDKQMIDSRLGLFPFDYVTVNRNYKLKPHRDAIQVKDTMVCMGVIRTGNFEFFETEFPEKLIAYDLQNGDCLLYDANLLHGTCFLKVGENARRYSIVAYRKERRK